ncbi:MAG: alpha-amylase family glycosyl hydrolase [Terriglobia bacterium]
MAPQSDHDGCTVRMHPHLYEINTWAWLEGQSRRAGKPVTLGAVSDEEWDKLHESGFDLVWLMGIWKRSASGRRIFRTDVNSFALYDTALPGWTLDDVVGSPYSIQDYVPDPRIGAWSEIDAVRRKLHDRNMGLILDFVPNHTGPDHPWIHSHPECYVQGSLADFRRNPSAFFLAELDDGIRFIARGKDPHFPAWPDTAQLNYFNPLTRSAMLEILGTISSHCDGVRCDMAMLCLNDVFSKTWGPLIRDSKTPASEFWPATIAAFPGFIWIAEAYWDLEWRMQQAGFNFTYDKNLYDLLRDGSPRSIRQRLKSDLSTQSRMARFLENHDEVRAISAFGKDKLPAIATIAATLPGLRFYHEGQLQGRKLHLPIQLGRAPDEPDDPEVAKLYARLLQISSHDVFHQQGWKLLEASSAGDASYRNLVVYRWQSGRDVRLVVANLGANASQGRICLDPPIDASRRYWLSDLLNDKQYEREGKDLVESGLFVCLEGYRAHIFEISIRG